MPRGYGGTAVLWQKGIDHLIVTLPDGGNRIQGVEIKGQDPLQLVSVVLLFYVHCKHLRSCWDGPFTLPHFSWAGLGLLSG